MDVKIFLMVILAISFIIFFISVVGLCVCMFGGTGWYIHRLILKLANILNLVIVVSMVIIIFHIAFSMITDILH